MERFAWEPYVSAGEHNSFASRLHRIQSAVMPTSCISFSLLLWQSATNLVAQNNRNPILSQFWGPEAWNQGVESAAHSPEALVENLFLASSSRFLWQLAFTDSWQCHSNLCLPGHIASFSSVYCQIFLCLPLMMMLTIAFRAHLDNQETLPISRCVKSVLP